MVDARDLDGERLIGSDRIGDNVLAILARVRDEGEAIRADSCVGWRCLVGSARNEAITQLLTLAGLRGLGTSSGRGTEENAVHDRSDRE